MSTDTAASSEPAVPARPRGRRARGGLRTLATTHAIAIFAQPVLAGMLLSGHYAALSVHAVVADVVYYVGLAQLAAAITFGTRTRTWWPTAVAALITAGETGQYLAGLAGALDLHLPLGVALVAATAVFVVALWCDPAVRR